MMSWSWLVAAVTVGLSHVYNQSLHNAFWVIRTFSTTYKGCQKRVCIRSMMHCRSATSVHVGPAGVLALPAHVTRSVLEVMLSDAQEFVAEWLEMRPVFQHRLFGQCLRPPLQVQIHLQGHKMCNVLAQIARP